MLNKYQWYRWLRGGYWVHIQNNYGDWWEKCPREFDYLYIEDFIMASYLKQKVLAKEDYTK